MTFATLSNIVTMLFCIAVLVQSVRLMRALRAVKSDDFGAIISALDASTARARTVLADLRETLRTECAANARVIAGGTAMREELTVMSGIADSVAERIMAAVSMSKNMKKPTAAKPKPTAKATPRRQSADPVAQRIVEPVSKSKKIETPKAAAPRPKPVAKAAPRRQPADPVAQRIVEPVSKSKKTETPRAATPKPKPTAKAAPRRQPAYSVAEHIVEPASMNKMMETLAVAAYKSKPAANAAPRRQLKAAA
jgi:hypothetical protein